MTTAIVCQRCGYIGDADVARTPAGPHHAKAICPNCGTFARWIQKPKESTGIERISADVKLCQRVRHEAARCAYCGRRATRYEAHHSTALEDGGPQADPGNVVALCHECHLLANWRQKQERERETRDKEVI